VDISQAQASGKKSMHFEAADTTNSSHLEVFTEGIRSQLSGKYASEMSGNYYITGLIINGIAFFFSWSTTNLCT